MLRCEKLFGWDFDLRKSFLKNGPESLKLILKIAFKEFYSNFRFEQHTFFRCSGADRNFPPERPEKSCSFYFATVL